VARKRILMTRFFSRWANDEGLTLDVLVQAVREIEDGLLDGDLGGGVIKKRVRVQRRGKRGGARVLLATNRRDRWIFIYGFLKNERANISHPELVALRELSRDLLASTEEQIDGKAQARILIEVGPHAVGAAEPHSPRGP
jgi:hypothetical protein